MSGLGYGSTDGKGIGKGNYRVSMMGFKGAEEEDVGNRKDEEGKEVTI